MTGLLRDVVDLIIAAGFVLIAGSGILSLAWPPFRRALLERLIGSAVYSITAKARAENEAGARRERLRAALGVLAEGLALNLATADSSRKISQAINELELEGPPEIATDLGAVVAAVEVQKLHDWMMSQAMIYELMKPIRAKVGPLLENPTTSRIRPGS